MEHRKTRHLNGRTYRTPINDVPHREIDRPEKRSAGGDYEDCLLEFSWVVRYTRAFLDGYLKHDNAAMNFLKATPKANGIPKHEMAVAFRAAKPIAATK